MVLNLRPLTRVNHVAIWTFALHAQESTNANLLGQVQACWVWKAESQPECLEHGQKQTTLTCRSQCGDWTLFQLHWTAIRGLGAGEWHDGISTWKRSLQLMQGFSPYLVQIPPAATEAHSLSSQWIDVTWCAYQFTCLTNGYVRIPKTPEWSRKKTRLMIIGLNHNQKPPMRVMATPVLSWSPEGLQTSSPHPAIRGISNTDLLEDHGQEHYDEIKGY
jgi:hypothetical protein